MTETVRQEELTILRQIIEKLAGKGRLLTVEARKVLEKQRKETLKEVLEKIDELLEKEEVFVRKEEIEQLLGEKEKEILVIPSAKVFHAEAKGIKSRMRILRNPGAKIKDKDVQRDVTMLMIDRLNKITRIITRKLGVKRIKKIGEVIRKNEKKAIVVGLVYNKREKKSRLILELEDDTGKILCLVDRERDYLTYIYVSRIPLDSIIGLSIRRIGKSMYYIEEVIFPEERKRIPKRSEEEVYLVLTSDLHVGSKMFLKDAFLRFVKWLNGKYGNDAMLRIASRVKYIIIAGDTVDGIGVFPGQEKQLEEVDVRKQYKMAAEILEMIPEYIEVVILPGNHDATLTVHPQPPIWRDFAEPLYELPNVHMVGNPVNVSFHGVNVLSYHGESLEDILTHIPGLSKEKISDAMRILLNVMHLCPIYGGKTRILPLKTDELIISPHPDIFQTGHIHINDHRRVNNTLLINSGTWQSQTDYQRERGWIPTPGKVPVINLKTGEMRILSFI